MKQFQDVFWGPNGFEELRKYIKQGNDFTKEINSILNERAELELIYAKGLSKLSNKVSKATKDAYGTMAVTWQEVAAQMELESELHRSFSSGLLEDVVKPLKTMTERHHKTRKQVESSVDKALRSLSDRRSEEHKAKKASHACTRENERLQDLTVDSLRSRGGGKVITDKDIGKLESKQRKGVECVIRADLEYYSACLRAERARQDWETAVARAAARFQAMDHDRLSTLHDLMQKYCNHLSSLGPKMSENCQTLTVAVSNIDVVGDVQTVIELRGTGRNTPEQMLPDFYAENQNNPMKKERRRESLEKILNLIRHDMELERKGKQGVQNLARALQETPTFGDADSQQEVHEKLQNMRAMLAYLEATRHKVQCALADMDGLPRPNHPLSSHLEHHRDRHATHSVLRVPRWVQLERRDSSDDSSLSSEASPESERTASSSASYSIHDQTTYGDYSTDGAESIYANLDPPHGSPLYKALYCYTATQEDELSFQPGDLITVTEKLGGGWWKGELNGHEGYFPESYVMEVS